jgi:hypothetical protein
MAVAAKFGFLCSRGSTALMARNYLEKSGPIKLPQAEFCNARRNIGGSF